MGPVTLIWDPDLFGKKLLEAFVYVILSGIELTTVMDAQDVG
jgi:hypothetical protein